MFFPSNSRQNFLSQLYSGCRLMLMQCAKKENLHTVKKRPKIPPYFFFSLTVLQAVSSTWSQKKAEFFIFQSETPTEILSDIPAFFLLMFFRLEDGHFYLKWKKCFKLNNILKLQGKGGSINWVLSTLYTKHRTSLGRGGGQGVSALAFYCNDPSLNPVCYLNFIYKKTTINGKEAQLAHF